MSQRTSEGPTRAGPIRGNGLRGETPSPAANSVRQVGLSYAVADGSTYAGNTFDSLDGGLEADASTLGQANSPTLAISGNRFSNVLTGIAFENFNNLPPLPPNKLSIRCNAFENPLGVSGVVGIRGCKQ